MSLTAASEPWEPIGRAQRLIRVHARDLLIVGLASLSLAGCGSGSNGDSSGPPDPDRSGLVGQVQLGPQCPVESLEEPCSDQPASQVTVTISQPLAGDSPAASEVVGRASTDGHGRFRIALPPGAYLVTADAGMSCEPMEARVVAGAFSRVDIACDTGIR